MKIYLAWACVVATAWLTVGCGGTSSNAVATVTKAQYIAQADAICARAEKRQLKLVGSFEKSAPSNQTEVKLVEYAGIPPLKEQGEELNSLPLPRKDAADAKRFVAAFRAGVKKAEGDPGSLLDETRPFAKAEAIAVKFGFKVCRGA